MLSFGDGQYRHVLKINNGFIVVWGGIEYPQTGNTWAESETVTFPISFTMNYPVEATNGASLYSHTYPNCYYTECTPTTIKVRVFNTAHSWLHYIVVGY